MEGNAVHDLDTFNQGQLWMEWVIAGWMEWNRSGSYGGYGEERRHALCDH